MDIHEKKKKAFLPFLIYSKEFNKHHRCAFWTSDAKVHHAVAKESIIVLVRWPSKGTVTLTYFSRCSVCYTRIPKVNCPKRDRLGRKRNTDSEVRGEKKNGRASPPSSLKYFKVCVILYV